ncbi:MAG TPA: hypothetical protein VIF60_12550 [Burkholderiaceae bacterium]
MPRQFIYQIYYDEASKAALDPRFIPLDNARNERPDWREYWPMRTFLKSNQLEADAYYGFFSPKFGQKTGLTGVQVNEFIDAHPADVYLFSPFIEQAAFFLNVFEHGEANHAGLMPAMQQFVTGMGMQIDLSTVVCDFNTSIFSNYMVAKPAFWQRWLEMGEHLFAISEAEEGPFARSLNAATEYHARVGPVGLKVFMMERLATLILLCYQLSTKAYDPFAITRSGIPASFLDHEMRIANALKMAFIQSRDARYIASFLTFRNKVLASL